MGRFELKEHTADLGVVGCGDDMAEALAWLATGMLTVMADLDSVSPRQSITVSVRSTDREALAVDWLNELLYRYEADGFLPKRFQVRVSEDGTELEAECLGEPADPARHSLRPAVKAATYHALEVEHNGEWRVQVILDM